MENYSENYMDNNGDHLVNEEWVPLSEIEGRYVAKVLAHTRGNKQAAARVLRVDRKTLDRMIKRHHIEAQALRERARNASNGIS
jgi:DNA-binding NtrC family response regulator